MLNILRKLHGCNIMNQTQIFSLCTQNIGAKFVNVLVVIFLESLMHYPRLEFVG